MSKVYWITGISGVGKTTFSNILKKELDRRNINSIIIDGDQIRKILKKQNEFSKESRFEIAMIYSRLAELFSNQNITVIVSTISLIKEIHSWNRKNLNNYVEILIKRDMNKILESDSRDIYNKNNVVGKSIDAEYPKQPDFTIENISIDKIESYIKNNIL